MNAKDLKDIRKVEDLIGVEPLSDVELFRRAAKGDASILTDRNVSARRLGQGDWTALHHLALKGVKEILQHPDVATAVDSQKETPLHFLARKEIIEVLQHPAVGTVKSFAWATPLHVLVCSRVWWGPDVDMLLSHPDIATQEDAQGSTPLHFLDYAHEILTHPACTESILRKDGSGNTVLHLLARNGINVLSHIQAHIVKNSKGQTPADLFDGMSRKERVARNAKQADEIVRKGRT